QSSDLSSRLRLGLQHDKTNRRLRSKSDSSRLDMGIGVFAFRDLTMDRPTDKEPPPNRPEQRNRLSLPARKLKQHSARRERSRTNSGPTTTKLPGPRATRSRSSPSAGCAGAQSCRSPDLHYGRSFYPFCTGALPPLAQTSIASPTREWAQQMKNPFPNAGRIGSSEKQSLPLAAAGLCQLSRFELEPVP